MKVNVDTLRLTAMMSVTFSHILHMQLHPEFEDYNFAEVNKSMS